MSLQSLCASLFLPLSGSGWWKGDFFLVWPEINFLQSANNYILFVLIFEHLPGLQD